MVHYFLVASYPRAWVKFTSIPQERISNGLISSTKARVVGAAALLVQTRSHVRPVGLRGKLIALELDVFIKGDSDSFSAEGLAIGQIQDCYLAGIYSLCRFEPCLCCRTRFT